MNSPKFPDGCAGELPAYVPLDEVAEVSGINREVLRRHLKRLGALRRIGNEYHHVDTSVLLSTERELYECVQRRRLQREMRIEELARPGSKPLTGES